jgi:monoamine oxidase
VVGPFHEAYVGLVEELGLTLVPAFPSLPGEDTSVLAEGRVIGDHFPWMSEADRASYDAEEAKFRALAATIDPDDPWSHPEAERLDRLFITGWRPGDVMAVGPLHGKHEPPFYVCGSDQWVCGYMEGAVRTGRGAARALLG